MSITQALSKEVGLVSATASNGVAQPPQPFNHVAVIVTRWRNEAVDGVGKSRTDFMRLMTERLWYVDYPSVRRGPDVTVRVVTDVHAYLKSRGLNLTKITLLTTNQPMYYKCNDSINALEVIGETCNSLVTQMYYGVDDPESQQYPIEDSMTTNSAAVGANASTTLGGDNQTYGAAIAPGATTDGETTSSQASVGARSNEETHAVKRGRRYTIIPDGDEDHAIKRRRFNSSNDAFGVKLGLRDVFSFVYDNTSKKLFFRNLPCGCPECGEGSYESCLESDSVGMPMECQWTMAA